jgi:hypothetical protein
MSEDLDRDLAEARAAAAADQRRRVRRARQILEEGATFAMLLATLCHRDADVLIDTVTGGHHVCRIERVSSDVVVASTTSGATGVIRHGAIAAVRAIGHGAELVTGEAADELAPRPITMAEILTELSNRRATATIGAGASESFTGEIRSVGVDIVTLMPRNGGAAVYVRLDSVSDVWFSAGS